MTLSNDELRKAVDAAPGWNPDCKNVVTTKDGIGKLHFPDDKTFIAALASALVDYVEANDAAVSIEPAQIKIGEPHFVGESCILFHAQTFDNRNGNRNENTIRAVLAWLEKDKVQAE